MPVVQIGRYLFVLLLITWSFAISQCTGDSDEQSQLNISWAPNENFVLELQGKEWENLTLAGPMLVNRLSQLMVLVSRSDVSLVLPPAYQMKYINQSSSFRTIVKELTVNVQSCFQRAHIEFNRLQLTMKQAPALLLDTFSIIQTETLDVLEFILGERLNDVSRLVNDSSDTSKSLKMSYNNVHELITEIDELVIYTQQQKGTVFLTEIAIHTKDIRQHSDEIRRFITTINSYAENMAASFVLQFIWFIQESMKPGIIVTPDTRVFMLKMLVPKAIDIDRTSDILAMMMRTYVDVSQEYMMDEIASSYNQLLLPTDDERRIYDLRLWKRFAEVSMKAARLTQIREGRFVVRDMTRSIKYQTFLLTPITN